MICVILNFIIRREHIWYTFFKNSFLILISLFTIMSAFQKFRETNAKSARFESFFILSAYFFAVYPKFPQDFTVRSSPIDNNVCITLNETRDQHWGTRYICYKPTIKKMNVTWSRVGRIRGLECVNTRMPFERAARYWYRTYLCVPSKEMFKFYWSIYGRMRNRACLKIRDNRRGGYYLCALKKHREIGEYTK